MKSNKLLGILSALSVAGAVFATPTAHAADDIVIGFAHVRPGCRL